jgi:flagellar hook-length control protein FliK
MSSLGAIGASRPSEQSQPKPAARADEPEGGTGFPEVLDTATSARAAAQTDVIPRRGAETPERNTTEKNASSARGNAILDQTSSGTDSAAADPLVSEVALIKGDDRFQQPTDITGTADIQGSVPLRNTLDTAWKAAPSTAMRGRRLQQRAGPPPLRSETADAININCQLPSVSSANPLPGGASSGPGAPVSRTEPADVVSHSRNPGSRGQISPIIEFAENGGQSHLTQPAALDLTQTEIAPPGGGTWFSQLPLSEPRSTTARAGTTTPDSNLAAPQIQSIAPDNLATGTAEQPPDVFAETTGSVPQHISAFSLPLRMVSEAHGGPGEDVRPLEIAPSPLPTGASTIAQAYPTGRSSDDNHLSTSVGPAAEISMPSTAGNFSVGSPANVGAKEAISIGSATGIADQLSPHLLRSAANGGGEVFLQLHPPELGDLTVRVLVNGRDVSAWFGSPQINVQEALSNAIGQLNANLGNAGYNLSSAWVGADVSSGRGDNESSATRSQRGVTNRARVEETSSSPVLPAGSGVSIYV